MSQKSVMQFFDGSSAVNLADLKLSSKNDHKIVMTSTVSGQKLIFEGSGFEFKNGEFRSGEIDDLSIVTDKGKTLFSFTNIAVDFATLPGVASEYLLEYGMLLGMRHDNLMIGSDGFDSLTGGLGRDAIKGRGGDDTLAGNIGKDVLTGGGGEDEFQFIKGDGRDTITDFDAGGAKQDLIYADYNSVSSITNVDGDAVINFGGGDTITLLGVKASQIDITDFVA